MVYLLHTLFNPKRDKKIKMEDPKKIENESEVKDGLGIIERVFPLRVSSFPRRRDVVGKAGEFIDDITENIFGEGIFRTMGISPDKTFLLSGEPGTGKTLSVRALNNEMNSSLIEYWNYIRSEEGMETLTEEEREMIMEKGGIPINPDQFKFFTLEYDIGKYGTAYINMSSRRIQKFFDTAIDLSCSGIPTMVVCDEADALLLERGRAQKHSEDLKVLETLMKNIQIVHDIPNMYLVLMTNMAEHIDKAVLRAGRIDKKYEFKLPTIEERESAFKRAIEKVNERAKYSVVRNYKTQNLAELSENFNYADIFQCVESALRNKAKEMMNSPRIEKGKIISAGYITQKGLERAVIEHKNGFKQEKHDMGFKSRGY